MEDSKWHQDIPTQFAPQDRRHLCHNAQKILLKKGKLYKQGDQTKTRKIETEKKIRDQRIGA
jgi:hypothetical protein